jgi:hypothetical protein
MVKHQIIREVKTMSQLQIFILVLAVAILDWIVIYLLVVLLARTYQSPTAENSIIALHKYFLLLQHKLAKYEMDGIDPPEHLLIEIDDTNRRLWIFGKALYSQ